jgi:YD repeat-containing protein
MRSEAPVPDPAGIGLVKLMQERALLVERRDPALMSPVHIAWRIGTEPYWPYFSHANGCGYGFLSSGALGRVGGAGSSWPPGWGGGLWKEAAPEAGGWPVSSGEVVLPVLRAWSVNHEVTTYTYDGIRRLISQLVPRNADGISTVRTDTLYDADGHVTDVCPPNEFTAQGSNACTSTGAFSTHRTYDVAGRMASSTTFRAAGPG